MRVPQEFRIRSQRRPIVCHASREIGFRNGGNHQGPGSTPAFRIRLERHLVPQEIILRADLFAGIFKGF